MYFVRRTEGLDEGDAKVSGMPMKTARAAASEKLSTAVIEMTAEVKHKFSAFRTADAGALPGRVC